MNNHSEVKYANDPNYLAYISEEAPPYWQNLSSTRPPYQPLFMDAATAETAIEKNLDMIGNEIRSLRIAGVKIDEEEAMQDGAEGLCDAAKRYETNYGAAFRTYAQYRVRGAIIDGNRRYDKLGGPDRNKARVVSLLNNTRAVSIFQTIGTLGHGDLLTVEDVTPADQPSTEEIQESMEAAQNLHVAIGQLEERQREVIMLKLQEMSRQAIADTLGVSLRTVKSDLEKAYAAIRDMLG